MDFKPLLSFLNAPAGCPYDSIHRAKAALMILKLPFSKVGNVTTESASRCSRAEAAAHPSDTHRRNKENVVPGGIVAAAAGAAGASALSDGHSMRFEDLTPSKVRSSVSLGVAMELRGTTTVQRD
jgi:hypothetical protein